MKVWVYVTAPGAHHQAFLRCQAHRSVHALTVPYRGCAASVAETCRKELCLLDRFANPFGRLQNDKMMACAVEPITPDPVLFVVFVGNRVVKGGSRQSLMERGIEYSHLLLIGE